MLEAIELRTESLKNPLGITAVKPRFSWKLSGDMNKKNQRQTAYQIICSESLNDLEEEKLLWDSGKVMSSETNHIIFQKKISSRQRIVWKVRVWDEKDIPGEYSQPGWFEEGLLDSSDWSAKWINPERNIDQEKRQPASYLRKTFYVTKGIESARLYMTACGIYECYLNGQKIGDQKLTPGSTQYDKRIQVQTYDVSSLLTEGENVLLVILADGWFRGMNGMKRRRNIYGEYIALLGQLEVMLKSGNQMTIVTDESWKVSQDGPIRFSDLMQGEVFDANKEWLQWNGLDYDDSRWHNAESMNLGYERLTGANSVVIKEHESFIPQIVYTGENETVLDFGQNISGYVSFTLNGSEDTVGKEIEITHGETLDADGKFTMGNLEENFDPSTPPLKQKVTYIASGQAKQQYKPLFSTFGFRYIKVQNWPGEIKETMFRAHAVYSDIAITTKFDCSNPMINRLVENTIWSLKGNFVDVPTDCPQRERAGYTGDAQVFVPTGSMLADSLSFYRKWLADLRSTQDKTGKISNIAPMQQKEFEYFDGSAGWGDAIVIVPYVLYQQYGDTEILRENYQAMKAWVDYEIREALKVHPLRKLKISRYKKYIWDTGKHWGEWLEPGQTMSYIMKRMYFGCPETATAYMFYSCKLLAEIGNILGKQEDAAYYAGYSENIRKAYQKSFLKDAFRSKRQCLAVRPLFMGLADGKNAVLLAKHLNELIIDNGYHLNTGFLSTPHICEVLAEYGYLDTAYRLLEQEEMPGWLYSVKKGATTIWEKWDSITEEGKVSGSLNHYSYGAVTGWLLQEAAGIKPKKSGYSEIVIAPKPGGSITYMKARLDSVKGVIESAWELENNSCIINISIPVNTSAEIYLPVSGKNAFMSVPEETDIIEKNGKYCCEVGSGTYRFVIDIKK